MRSIILTVLLMISVSLPVYSGDHDGEHPGKEADPKKALHSLKGFIKSDSKLKGGFFIYDKKVARVRDLRLVRIHKLREVNGKFYTCADFKDSNKDEVDLDFYLTKDKREHWKVVKIMLHKVNGVARYKPPKF